MGKFWKKLKTLRDKIDNTFMAAAFAEAGCHDYAIEVMEEKDKPQDYKEPDKSRALQMKVTRISEESPSSRDYYTTRILELADGRPIKDIVKIMYREELTTGLSPSHVTMWQRTWENDLVTKIENLAKEGYLKLGSNNKADENGA